MTDNNNAPSVLTRAGYEKLQRELEYLSTQGRANATENLMDTGDDTDIIEETTFHEAVRDKALLEARISDLRRVLANAQIIDDDPDPTTASPGDRVIVWDEVEKTEFSFDLLGGAEIAMGRRHGVSLDSPVGKALLGKKVGETIEIETPDGTARYTIRRFEQIV